jgi:hypothetical protein
MKPMKWVGCLCLAASAIGAASMATTQEGPEVPRPTSEHKVLAADVGTWDATITSYMGPPGAEPAVSKGVEVNEMMTGGLWLVSRFEGEIGGMKMEQRGQFGYDPVKKKYIGTSIVSMNPTLSVFEGTYDTKTRTMTYVGGVVDPASKTTLTQRIVSTSKDDTTRAFTLYIKPAGGDEVKAIEIRYTKRK